MKTPHDAAASPETITAVHSRSSRTRSGPPRAAIAAAVAAAILGTVAVVLGVASFSPAAPVATPLGRPDGPTFGGVSASALAATAQVPTAADPPGATRPGTRPPVVDHGPRAGNRVALTFDADMTDGMLYSLRSGQVESYANLHVIEVLERDEIPATFFLTGKWVERYPEITRRIAGNPRFELANHTYGHKAFTADCYGLPQVPAATMAEDVARTFTLIERYGGRQTRYFRFPGLCHDGAALAALAPLGLTVVDGDVVSGDPFATAWEPIVRAVLTQVTAGSVVIMHVTEANATMTDEALPHILAGLRERGLVAATLSEVLAER